jgi:hypothetical protein
MQPDTSPGMADLDTPAKLRAFLKLCLNPGHGRDKRTPVRLLEVLPAPMHDQLIQHAPHLRPLRHRVEALAEQQRAAHDEYADALAAWIRGDEQPAGRRSLPLLDAVSLAYDAAVQHIDDCDACRPDMRLAEMCPAGQRAAVEVLDVVPAAATACAHDNTDDVRTAADVVIMRRCLDCGGRLPAVIDAECAHVAWEVTSQVPTGDGRWRKCRRCSDCDERLAPVIEREPHPFSDDVRHDRPADDEPVRAYAPGDESEISTRGWTA